MIPNRFLSGWDGTKAVAPAPENWPNALTLLQTSIEKIEVVGPITLVQIMSPRPYEIAGLTDEPRLPQGWHFGLFDRSPAEQREYRRGMDQLQVLASWVGPEVLRRTADRDRPRSDQRHQLVLVNR